MHPCWRVCDKNLNIVSMCAVSTVVHTSKISSCQINFFSFPLAVSNSMKVGPLVLLLQMFVITENIMKRPVFNIFFWGGTATKCFGKLSSRWVNFFIIRCKKKFNQELKSLCPKSDNFIPRLLISKQNNQFVLSVNSVVSLAEVRVGWYRKIHGNWKS
jgi:hypothetical protein